MCRHLNQWLFIEDWGEIRDGRMGMRLPSAMCNGSQTSTVSKFKETKAEMFLFSLFLTAAT